MTSNNISKRELKEELIRLSGEVSGTPTANDMRENGCFSISPYKRVFGSWNGAIKQCGLTVENRNGGISNDELLDYITNYYEEKGQPPTSSEIESYSGVSVDTFIYNFGSWNNALNQAGFEPVEEFDIEKECLLIELRNLDIDGKPTINDMDEIGLYSSDTYRSRFGSWNNALNLVGYESRDYKFKQGRENRFYDGGTAEYYGPNWETTRAKILDRDGYKCRICNRESDETSYSLFVHHIKPRKEFMNDDGFKYEKANQHKNLVTLCNRCHGKFEGKYTECNYNKFIEEASKDLSTNETNT